MQKITTEAVVDADVAKVWRDYTDPECITGWAFASADWECPHAENDLRVGGRFLTRMAAKDASFGFDFTGTYTEVVEFSKLAYVMDRAKNESVARTCDVWFEVIDAQHTKVTVTFDSEDENPVEMQKAGWQSILDNFKKFTENH